MRWPRTGDDSDRRAAIRLDAIAIDGLEVVDGDACADMRDPTRRRPRAELVEITYAADRRRDPAGLADLWEAIGRG